MKKLSYKNYFFALLLLLASNISCSVIFAEDIITNHPQSLLECGSPEQYYNEALRAEEAGNNLEAVLALRRALVLDPTLAPARAHLRTLLEKMSLPVDASWQVRTTAHVSPELLMILGSMIGWSATLLVIWLFFARHAGKRKFLWSLGVGVFLIGHGMTLLGFLIDPRVPARHQVILFPRQGALRCETPLSEIPLRSIPTDNGEVITQLPAGSLLTLLSRHGAWSYVGTSAGQQGWISSSLMEPLTPKEEKSF